MYVKLSQKKKTNYYYLQSIFIYNSASVKIHSTPILECQNICTRIFYINCGLIFTLFTMLCILQIWWFWESNLHYNCMPLKACFGSDKRVSVHLPLHLLTRNHQVCDPIIAFLLTWNLSFFWWNITYISSSVTRFGEVSFSFSLRFCSSDWSNEAGLSLLNLREVRIICFLKERNIFDFVRSW